HLDDLGQKSTLRECRRHHNHSRPKKTTMPFALIPVHVLPIIPVGRKNLVCLKFLPELVVHHQGPQPKIYCRKSFGHRSELRLPLRRSTNLQMVSWGPDLGIVCPTPRLVPAALLKLI